jgi:hypothetical protein
MTREESYGRLRCTRTLESRGARIESAATDPARADDRAGTHPRAAQACDLKRDVAQRAARPRAAVGRLGRRQDHGRQRLANELEVDCYQVEAPISHDTLLELREVMRDNDILFIDEIHQQAIMERRGRQSSTQPEVLYHVLEDRSLITDRGMLDFPAITVIGATTDEGMLPDPFINRFPLRPTLEPYTQDDLMRRSPGQRRGARRAMGPGTRRLFARASRGVPRQINNYVRNGAALGGRIDVPIAHEVVGELNRHHRRRADARHAEDAGLPLPAREAHQRRRRDRPTRRP